MPETLMMTCSRIGPPFSMSMSDGVISVVSMRAVFLGSQHGDALLGAQQEGLIRAVVHPVGFDVQQVVFGADATSRQSESSWSQQLQAQVSLESLCMSLLQQSPLVAPLQEVVGAGSFEVLLLHASIVFA
jgi:hypothetical protein